ncbi:MAG: hypothetical protein WC533_00480 [Candidatus Pacearchaeota archaeon]
MKKELVMLCFLVLFISSVSALEIQSETSFSKGETFLASIGGNILDNIQFEDVKFLKGHVQQNFKHDILKINNNYYIYAVLPYNEAEYTLVLENVYYMENNKIILTDLTKNFTIINTTVSFNVYPGVIITDKDFKITVYNNEFYDSLLTYTLSNKTDTETVKAQELTEVEISIKGVEETTFETLSLSLSTTSYEIPVYIITNQTIGENESEETTPVKLVFADSEIQDILNIGKEYSYFSDLFNIGENESKKVNLSVSSSLTPFLKLNATSFASINSKQKASIEFKVNFTDTGLFEGFIRADSDNSSDILSIIFLVGQDIPPDIERNGTIPPNINITNITKKKTCSEMGGKKCTGTCSDNTKLKLASDGLCCLGTCSEDEKPKRNWTVIIIIVFALAVIGFFVWWKVKKPKTSEKDIFNKREKSFEERYETSGKLTRE